MRLPHRKRPDDRINLTPIGLSALEAMCASPACPLDESVATTSCFVCGAKLCQHPACSQLLVRATGNVTLCAGDACRGLFDLRERVQRGEVTRG